VIELTGRYPEEGLAQNLISKEMAYVVDGGGKVIVEGVEYPVNEGDIVLIEPGEKFYWEGIWSCSCPVLRLGRRNNIK